MEKQLLAIVSNLAEFKQCDYEQKFDQKNLSFRNLNSSRWRLFLEDFDVSYSYVAGNEYILGDVFSRLPRLDDVAFTEGKTSASPIDVSC